MYVLMRATYRLHCKSQNLDIWHAESQDDSTEWFFSFFWIFDFYGSYGHFVFFHYIFFGNLETRCEWTNKARIMKFCVRTFIMIFYRFFVYFQQKNNLDRPQSVTHEVIHKLYTICPRNLISRTWDPRACNFYISKDLCDIFIFIWVIPPFMYF